MRSEIKEYQAVEEAAMKFVKSVAEGNSKYAKELFTDEAVLFGYLDGELEHGSIEQFYHLSLIHIYNNPLHKGPFQKGKRKKVHGNDGDRHRIDDA